MKLINNKISWFCFSFVLLSAFIMSCEDDEGLGKADRLFRPVVTDQTYGGTWIKLEWDKYEGVNSFNLDLSTDSFVTMIQQVETDTTVYTFENLEYDTEYFIRIKSVGDNIESRYFENEVIKTSDYPTKLNAIANVTDTEVKVTWEDVSYDSLLVMRGDTVDVSHIVTEEENNLKEAVITDLLSDTVYVVRAYYGGSYQGKKSFETAAPQVFVGDVVDLRIYPADESYKLLSQDFFDDLATNHPTGATVVLRGGTKYELSGPVLSSPVNLVTGYSVRGNAIVEVSGNFDVDGAAVIDKLYFESISFIDHPDHPRTDGNYGSTYVFNISNSGASIDSLLFESCDIRYKRGGIRIKTGATVKAIEMNNCFIDSIAGYGVVNLDNGGVITNSISVTNSTVAHTEMILRSDKMSQNLETLIFSNVTTYHTPKSVFFRMGNIDKVSVSKCVFGAVWDSESGAEGLKTGAVVESSVTENYKTSDCVWAVVKDEQGNITGLKNPIEVTELSDSSNDVFANPESNDYTLLNSSLKGNIGDPRWW